jgi:hypothetical protein
MDPHQRQRARAAMSNSLILKEDAPAVLDGMASTDYSFIFETREASIDVPLHRLIRKYAEYRELFAAQN